MNIRYQAIVLFTLILLLTVVLGCTSKDSGSRDATNPPAVTQTLPEIQQDAVSSLETRIVSSPAIPRQQGSLTPKITLPPTDPVNSGNLNQIMEAAETLATNWDPIGLTCQGNSCTATFINTNKDTATVRVTLYPDSNTATAAYYSQKQADSSKITVPLEIPEESYGWMQKTRSGVTFRKGVGVGVAEYTSSNGPATVAMAQEFAKIYSRTMTG